MGCGHMTGRSFEGAASKHQSGWRNTMFFLSHDLAKLNPKCHMNYSIIFKEISFYAETSSFCPKIHNKVHKYFSYWFKNYYEERKATIMIIL